ncbi:125_t:CDS:2 [Entrophospora sp. SA101]|nr:125_t:CDS:2 [Entrophospora sp. SA101]
MKPKVQNDSSSWIENTKLKQIIKQNRTTNDPLQSSASTQSPIPSPINDEDDSTDSINLEQEQNSISLEGNPNNILNHKSTEEKKLDDFLNRVTKEKVSNLIRDRNLEKKILQSNEDPTSEDITAETQKEKRKCVIEMALEWCPYLSLDHSNEYSDIYNFNSSVHCPICNKDHEKDNIRNNINGQWGSGDYANTETYRLKCWEACQKSIQIVTVKA